MACGSVKQPSVPRRYWKRDVVKETVSQVRPINVLWGGGGGGGGQGCKVANQVESCCSGLRSRGKLERHAACHYLIEMSD